VLDVTAHRTGLRRIGIGTLAVAAVFAAGACAAGQRAATANESPAIDANGATIGDLRLANVAIKAPSQGQSYPAGASVELQAFIVNTSANDDTLTGVSSSASASAAVYDDAAAASSALSPSATSVFGSSGATSSTPSSTAPGTNVVSSGAPSVSAGASASTTAPATTSVTIPAGQSVSFGQHDTDKVIVLSGISKPLFPGTTIAVTFTFQNAGSVTLQVPVQLTNLDTVTPASIPGTPTEG
jgi:copper(I)-binding protein